MSKRCPKCQELIEKDEENFCPFCGEVLNKDLKLMLDINKILKEPKKEVKKEKKVEEVPQVTQKTKDAIDYDISRMSDDDGFNWKPVVIVLILIAIACAIYFGLGI